MLTIQAGKIGLLPRIIRLLQPSFSLLLLLVVGDNCSRSERKHCANLNRSRDKGRILRSNWKAKRAQLLIRSRNKQKPAENESDSVTFVKAFDMLVENDVSAHEHDSDSSNPGLVRASGEGRDERGNQPTTVQGARIIDYAYFS